MHMPYPFYFRKYFNIFIYIYIFFINISYINNECGEEVPFKNNGICSPIPCADNELSSGDCYIDNSKIKTQWLNNIILFYNEDNKTHYRAGAFAINKDGDLVIEYSYKDKRLFYGLKKDRSYYFTSTDYITIPSKIINMNDSNANRHE